MTLENSLENWTNAIDAQSKKSKAISQGIYVASRATDPRASMWRALREAGWPIISTWIDENGPGQTADFGELWSRIQREVTNAKALVLYAETEDFPLKGAYIEAGMALAAGVPIYVILNGVELEPRSCRPVGSWINHPGVTQVESLMRLEEILRADDIVPARQQPALVPD